MGPGLGWHFAGTGCCRVRNAWSLTPFLLRFFLILQREGSSCLLDVILLGFKLIAATTSASNNYGKRSRIPVTIPISLSRSYSPYNIFL